MSQRLVGLRPRVVLAFAGILVGYSAAHAQSAGGSGKIPVTTSSAEAKRQYVKGRTLGGRISGPTIPGSSSPRRRPRIPEWRLPTTASH